MTDQFFYNTSASTLTFTGGGITTSSGSVYAPQVFYSGGIGSTNVAPAPRPRTNLDWLDDEVEAVCALARAAGELR